MGLNEKDTGQEIKQGLNEAGSISADNSQIKALTNVLIEGDNSIEISPWELGRLTGGTTGDSSNRIITPNFISPNVDVVVSVGEEYKIGYTAYNAEKEYGFNQDWVEGALRLSDSLYFNLESFPYYRFMLARIDGADMSASESENVEFSINLFNPMYASPYHGMYMYNIGDSITHMERWQPTVVSQLGLAKYSVNAVYGGTLVDNYTDVNDTPLNIDISTVWYGTNDYANSDTLGAISDTPISPTTFYGALKYVAEWLCTNIPLKKHVFITPMYRYDTDEQQRAIDNGVDARGNAQNTIGLTLEAYADAVIDVGKLYGIKVIDMYHESGVNKFNVDDYTDDGLHMSVDEAPILGRKIASEINAS